MINCTIGGEVAKNTTGISETKIRNNNRRSNTAVRDIDNLKLIVIAA